MPYYREQRAGKVTDSFVGASGAKYPIVWESSKAMTFRSRPSSKELTSREVLDVEVDPYAYFLDSTSRRRYQALLKERGLPAEGSPDSGHPFELTKHIIKGKQHSFVQFDPRFPLVRTPYTGVLVAPGILGQDPLGSVHAGDLLSPAPYKETGLDVFAQQAYNKVAPTSVIFNAAAFLGELREGLPKLTSEVLKSDSKAFKSIGSDYLNVQFGWIPFLTDLQKAGNALATATTMLSKQGQRLHRKMSLPEQVDAGERSLTGQPLYYNAGLYGLLDSQAVKGLSRPSGGYYGGQIGVADVDYLKSRTTRRWFEGEFTSFMPLGFDPSSYFSRLAQLTDVRLTPSTLWQLTPWSWLVDWALKIGDTIEANEKASNDLLVMHYGYAMEQTVYKTHMSWKQLQSPDTQFSRYEGWPSKGTVYSETVYKRRLRANPYGFRIGGSQALSGGQIAILGALGLTKIQ